MSSGLRGFVQDLFELEGAATEPLEPDGLEVLAPPELHQPLGIPEHSRLGFGAELPPGARRVGLEADWMDKLEGLMGARGRAARRVLDFVDATPSDPERLAQRALDLGNATFRLTGVHPAWTRYWLMSFRYSALSDEKRDGILHLGLNLSSGSTLDNLLDGLRDALALEPFRDRALPADSPLPPPWPAARLSAVLERTLPARARHALERFLASMRRRQGRDLARVHDYHAGLRAESLASLRVLERKATLTERQQKQRERESQRLAAVAREYDAKVEDLKQKYALSVEIQWLQTLEVVAPVQRFELLLKRRKGERRFTLDWSPLVRKLEQPPCEYSHTWERPRLACDERLHLVAPAALGPCGGCGKAYCRACHPQRCPHCRRAAP